MRKKILAMTLAAAMVVTTFVTSISASAAANVNKSVDKDAKSSGVTVITTYTLPVKKSELTIGLKGKYQLKLDRIGLSKEAKEYGFRVINDTTIAYDTKVNGKVKTVRVNVTWSSANTQYAPISKKGTVTANKVSPVSASTGKYLRVPMKATIPNITYVNSKGENLIFTDGIIATSYVTIVPEEDLSVYFLGVWHEDETDEDAQHKHDFSITSANVGKKLKEMAEEATGRSVGKTYDIVSYTKTNNGEVRVYLKTNGDKGIHYYALKFLTKDRVNQIDVTERHESEAKYKPAGTYYRGAK